MERVQGLFGWACACCTPNRPPSGGHVVGPWRQEDGTVIWTRREATAAGWQYARIDALLKKAMPTYYGQRKLESEYAIFFMRYGLDETGATCGTQLNV